MLRRTRVGPVVGVLLVLALAAWALRGTDEDDALGCGGLRVTGWQADQGMTREFARYGDDNSRTDDWTGGDGSRSVRLPDGRTLWLSADTFLDKVYPGGERVPNPSWVRNSALVMSPEGHVQRTLTGEPGSDGRPAALFPGWVGGDGEEAWRWPVQAVVEPRASGSAERVVRVLLWQRAAGAPPWVFGVPQATEVATLSLPDLELRGISPVNRTDPASPPEQRVLYGTSAVRDEGWTYVFGADERGVRDGGASNAYVARVPSGGLADSREWRYWTGTAWSGSPTAAEPLDFGRHPESATNTYTVVQRGGTWLLLTMDAGGPDGKPSADVVSYWSCSPVGPWRGPDAVGRPPLPTGGEAAGASAYNPQGHIEFSTGGRDLLLGYDVNVLGDADAIHRNVDFYRPRFLRLELGPV
ncbi:hypothetical protein AN216_15205 [Streptomyces oceani]|uniref:DUF4185 domain-containing protein n=2 Tax=Streptomyces oceani TaxID=1075402 RepID=A0A1E7KG71_9ACTN|nr:hypothetical protein AN216_15205 [Streptomyces oceani]